MLSPLWWDSRRGQIIPRAEPVKDHFSHWSCVGRNRRWRYHPHRVLLLLLALAQGPAVRSEHYLTTYLPILSAYAAGERTAALGEIRKWRSVEIDVALSALRLREGDLRAVPASPQEIDFHLVEASVLLHAEVAFLALQGSSMVDAGWHLRRSTALFEWSRHAARRLRERAAKRGAPRKSLPPAFDIRERISPRDFYLALAASALVFGQGPAARIYAEEAVKAAPLDAEVHLVLGCAVEYVANEQVLNEDASAAVRLRREAEAAFRKAHVLDPGLFEARLRLGHVLLAERRFADAEPMLAEAEALATDERSRYLTRLFRGRAAERRGRPTDAEDLYRRALEAWPSAQTARLALAHAREASGDASAARAHVAATLEASRQDARPTDPFWVYTFGPPGFAKARFDRILSVIQP